MCWIIFSAGGEPHWPGRGEQEEEDDDDDEDKLEDREKVAEQSRCVFLNDVNALS